MCHFYLPRYKRGFTLIELLIVVAIIAILAAIAVPNFLEAQVRAKVSRVRADVRSTATALESYKIDANVYPPAAEYPKAAYVNGNWTNDLSARIPSWLSTPIAYMTSLQNDIFVPAGKYNANQPHWYRYIYYNYPEMTKGVASPSAANVARAQVTGGYLFYSFGPDQASNQHNDTTQKPDTVHGVYLRYDPTNGTNSLGNVIRTGASPEGYVPHHASITGAPKGPN